MSIEAPNYFQIIDSLTALKNWSQNSTNILSVKTIKSADTVCIYMTGCNQTEDV